MHKTLEKGSKQIMKIKDKQLNRRKLFEGLSSMIVAAPLYRMLLDTQALAATPSSKAIFVYIPGGITASQWFPSGTETNFTLPFISSPLEALKSDLIMFQGLNSIGPGNHSGGPMQVFAGGGGDGTTLNSLDQAIAQKYKGTKLFNRIAVGLGSTQSGDGNLCSYSNGAGIKTLDDPVANYNAIFGSITGNNNSTNEVQKMRDITSGKKRLIDFAMKDLNILKAKLGSEEQEIFESHLHAVDLVGQDLQALIDQNNSDGGDNSQPTNMCQAQSIDFSGLDQTHSYFPLWYHKSHNTMAIARINSDIMIQAFACDLTNVGLMQFGASNTQMALNFDGYPFEGTIHHSLTHGGGQAFYNAQQGMVKEAVKIAQALKSIEVGGKSLLSQMTIFGSSCIGGDPNNHDGRNIPCFILGQANGNFQTGRFLKYTDLAYNHLLVSIANAHGLGVNSYGNGNFTGGLAGL